MACFIPLLSLPFLDIPRARVARPRGNPRGTTRAEVLLANILQTRKKIAPTVTARETARNLASVEAFWKPGGPCLCPRGRRVAVTGGASSVAAARSGGGERRARGGTQVPCEDR